MNCFTVSVVLRVILICTRIQKACSKAGRFCITDINPVIGTTYFIEIEKGIAELLQKVTEIAYGEDRNPVIIDSLIAAKKLKVANIIAERGNHSGSVINNCLFLLSEECSEVITSLVLWNNDEFWLEFHDVIASFNLLEEAVKSELISIAKVTGKD